LEKVNKSTRFLSSLKTIQLNICEHFVEILSLRITVMKLITIKNQNLLRHVTHLKIANFHEKEMDWGLFQSLINFCPRLCFVSLPTGDREISQDLPNIDFCLDLSCLHNLQVLRMRMLHFRSFLNGINLPSSLQEISLDAVDNQKPDNFREVFNDVHKNEDK